MPTYCYECKECQKNFEEAHSIAEREEPLQYPCVYCGGKLEIVIVAAAPLIDPFRLGRHKPDSTHEALVKRMKKTHPLSNL